ncbi:HSP81-1, partial [Symbiodinium sp. KB8]
WEVLNKQKPLWTRKPEEVTTDEYASFYKSLTNDWDSHAAVKHFSVEGQLEFSAILFAPARAPFDMFDKIADLLRYQTSKSGEDLVSLKEYVERMKEGQPGIYYISGESKAAVEDAPFLEQLKKKGYEEVLGEKVVVSTRLAESPCCLVTGEYGWSARMEQIMKAQALRDASMSTYMASKKTMEVNPSHPIVVSLRQKAAHDRADRTVKDLIWLMYDTALLTSGFSLEEPVTFAGRIHRLIMLGLGVGDDDEDADAGATGSAEALSDLPPLDAAEGEDASGMEEVD